jgi:hypothetical protein
MGDESDEEFEKFVDDMEDFIWPEAWKLEEFERFFQHIPITKAILKDIEALEVGNHIHALDFLNRYGALQRTYASQDHKPWNPARLPFSSNSNYGFTYASQFWATILQFKRVLWLNRMTTTEVDFLFEALDTAKVRTGLEVHLIRWPDTLRPAWADFGTSANQHVEGVHLEPADSLTFSDNPYVSDILGPVEMDPLDLAKDYIAKRISVELTGGSCQLAYTLDKEYREFHFGTLDQHIWRHIADRVLRVAPARRCENPNCNKVIKPKRTSGRFCNGTCRQAYNRHKKAKETNQ